MGNDLSTEAEIELAQQVREHQREMEAGKAKQEQKDREYQIEAERKRHEHEKAEEKLKSQRELAKLQQEHILKAMEHENRMRMAHDQTEILKLEMERKAEIAQQQATDRHSQEMQKAKQQQMEMEHQRKMELAEAELKRMKNEEQRLKKQHEEDIKKEKIEADAKLRELAEKAKMEREYLAGMTEAKLKEAENKSNARAEEMKKEMTQELTRNDERHDAAMILKDEKAAAKAEMLKVKFENDKKELEGGIKQLQKQILAVNEDLATSESEKKEQLMKYTADRDHQLKQLDGLNKKMHACQKQLMVQIGGMTQKRFELQALMSEIIPEAEHNNQYKWMPPPLWIGVYSAIFGLLSIRTGDLSMIFNGLILGFILYGAFIYYYFDQGRMLVLKLKEGNRIADQIVESERVVFDSMEAMTGVKIDVPISPFDQLSMDTLPKQIADRQVSPENLKMLHDVALKIKSDRQTMYTYREKVMSIEVGPSEAIADIPSTNASPS